MERWTRYLNLIVRACGVMLVGLGMMVMVGWHIRHDGILRFFTGHVPMVYITALSFFLLGLGLLSISYARIPGIQVVSGVVGVVFATLTFAEYLFNVDLGIDRFFVNPYLAANTLYPGRMAPNTALCFILAGTFLLVHKFSIAGWPRRIFLVILGSGVCALGLVAFSGYLIGLEPSYGWIRNANMAFHTAGGFVLFGLAALVICIGEYVRFAPVALSIFIGIVLSFHGAHLFQYMDAQKSAGVLDESFNASLSVIRREMGYPVEALHSIKAFYGASREVESAEFRTFVMPILERFPFIRSMSWSPRVFKEDGRSMAFPIQFSQPESASREDLGRDLFADLSARAVLEMSVNSGEEAVMPGARNPNTEMDTPGTVLIAVYLPIFKNEAPHETETDRRKNLSGVVRAVVDFEILMGAALPSHVAPSGQIHLFETSADREHVCYFSSGRCASCDVGLDAAPALGRKYYDRKAEMDWVGRKITVAFRPSPDMVGDDTAESAWVFLIGGLLITASMAYILFENAVRSDKIKLQVDERTAQLNEINKLLLNEIADRKDAQSALELSRERIRMVLETAHDAFVGMDSAGKVVEWNREAESIFGWSRHEAVGRTMSELITPEKFRAAHQAGLKRFLSTGDQKIFNRRIEIEALRKDGRTFPVEMVIWPIKEGSAFMFNAFIRDLTAIREAEQREKKLQDDLLQSEKMRLMGQVLSGTAHELNNPLTGIMGYAQLLLGDPNLPPAVRNDVQAIHLEAARCSKIVKDLLAFARKRDPERRACDINAVVSAVVERFHYALTTGGHELAIRLDSRIPVTLADSHQLEQILFNLISNSIHAMADSPARRMEIASAWIPEDNRIRISVQDSGNGLTRDQLQKIFEPFYTTKEAGKGTGLGLSVSLSIAEAHGGKILVRSDGPGTGATFVVDLPHIAPPA